MDIGIIGSGNIGGTLARRLTALRHQVSIANSRGPASLAALAAETGATAAEDVARARDVVIVAVPEAAVPQLPREVLAASPAVVVDTGNYYPSRDGRIADSWRQHPGTPAYCRDLDAGGLKATLAQADAGQIADYRAQADEAARAYFAPRQNPTSNLKIGGK